jgi:hypothetical protein
MKKSLFAGAAVAVATIGLPILAWAADPAATPAQSPAPATSVPAATTPATGTPATGTPATAPGAAAGVQSNPGEESWRSRGAPWQRMEEGRIGPGGMPGGMRGPGTMGPGTMGPGMMGPGMMSPGTGPGMMMRQAWMRHHAMWHHGWHHQWRQNMSMNLQQRCVQHIARRAALRAYVAARLDFTAAQLPLWQKLEAQFDTADQAAHQLCAGLPTAPQPQTFLDRINRRQQVLSARLTALKAELPDMTALYQALTPQQRTLVDHPFRRR